MGRLRHNKGFGSIRPSRPPSGKGYPYVALGENQWVSSRGDVYREHFNSHGKFAGLRAVMLAKQDKAWRKAT